MQKINLKKIIGVLLICLGTSSCSQYCMSNRVLVEELTHENLDYMKCEIKLSWFNKKILGKSCK